MKNSKSEVATKIVSLKAKNTQNSIIMNALIKRVSDDKTSDNVARIILALAVELTLNDTALNNDNTIASRNAYALQKVTLILSTLRKNALNTSAIFQNYVQSIMLSMKKRASKTATNNLSNAIIAASIECSEIRATDKRKHKAVSTAATQRSSTSYALHACNVANYNAKDKTLTFKETSEAKQIIELLK